MLMALELQLFNWLLVSLFQVIKIKPVSVIIALAREGEAAIYNRRWSELHDTCVMPTASSFTVKVTDRPVLT